MRLRTPHQIQLARQFFFLMDDTLRDLEGFNLDILANLAEQSFSFLSRIGGPRSFCSLWSNRNSIRISTSRFRCLLMIKPMSLVRDVAGFTLKGLRVRLAKRDNQKKFFFAHTEPTAAQNPQWELLPVQSRR